MPSTRLRVHGLFPANKEVVMLRIVDTLPEHLQRNPDRSEAGPSTTDDTPRKLLRRSILNIISPPASDATKQAQLQKRQTKKRVQAKTGEVLTSQIVLDRLEKEAQERQTKKEIKKFSKMVDTTPTKPKKSAKRKLEVIDSDSYESDVALEYIFSSIHQDSDIEDNDDLLDTTDF